MSYALPAGCPLTPSEYRAMRLTVLRGWTAVEIARRLQRSPHTIRTQLHNAYRKLRVHSAAEAATVCFNAGWMDPNTTEITNPIEYEDHKVTERQRVYLWAFDHNLAAREDDNLEQAKILTDAATKLLGCPARSIACRDWMDPLIQVLRRLDDPKE